nr:tyrosine-type recombinase/integrase [Nonomuraea harbinensis]
MARTLDEDELIEHWLLTGRTGPSKLALALWLKFFAQHGRFPEAAPNYRTRRSPSSPARSRSPPPSWVCSTGKAAPPSATGRRSARSWTSATRGVRAMLARYAAKAGLTHNMPPHRLRHFLFTWLKSQGIDDALIQPYSGHASRTSLEIYSKIALGPAQETYGGVIDQFPV